MKIAAEKNVISDLSNGLRRLLRTLRAELRRGIVLAGEKHMNGIVPPL